MNLENFILAANKLKDVKRTGWVERGIEKPESVADHSLMAALMGMVLPVPKGFDRDRIIKMLLIHDLVEAEVGDIVTKENWPKGGTMLEKDKLKLEKEGIIQIISYLGKNESVEIKSLWDEYNECKTPEAAFANDIDVAERTIQAKIYHDKGNYKKPIIGFWAERNLKKIKNKDIKKIVTDIIEKGR